MNFENGKVRTAVTNLLILSFSVIMWFLPIPSARYPNEKWLINDMANRASAVLTEIGGNGARSSTERALRVTETEVSLIGRNKPHQVVTYRNDNITALCLCELVFLFVIGLASVRRKRHLKALAHGLIAWTATFAAIFIGRAIVFGVMIVLMENVAIIQLCDTPLRMAMMAIPLLTFIAKFIDKEAP